MLMWRMYRLSNTKRVFVKQQVIFEPDRSRTNINNFIEAWHNYLLSLYYEVVKIQPPTREVTSPDRSWSYEVDVERKSSTRENMDIPNWKTLGKWFWVMKSRFALIGGTNLSHEEYLEAYWLDWVFYPPFYTRLETALRGQNCFYTCTAFLDLRI